MQRHTLCTNKNPVKTQNQKYKHSKYAKYI